MAFHVVITARAEMDIDRAHDCWSANRSRLEADRWYYELKKAILDLADNPLIHSVSRKSHCSRLRSATCFSGLVVDQRTELYSRSTKIKFAS